MNYNLTNCASLIRDDITTLEVTFSAGDNQRYTFKVLKSVVAQFHPERRNRVLVHTKHGLKVADVAAVHDQPTIGATGMTIKWAFQWVDERLLDELMNQDAAVVEKLQAHQQQSERQQVLAALGITDAGEFMGEIKALAFTSETTHD